MKNGRAVKLIAIIAIVCLGLSACSSEKKSTDNQSLQLASTDEGSRGINAAAKILAQGIIDANGDVVFAQISTACQNKISRTEVSNQLRTARAYLTTFLGADMNDFKVKSIETRKVNKAKTGQARYTIVVEGNSRDALAKFQEDGVAPVESTSTQPAQRQTTTTTLKLPFDDPTDWFDFVYERSSWKLQSCEEFLAASGMVPGNKTTSTIPAK